MLIVLGTPIGNIGDISKRALETLSTARFIAAEDTRTTTSLASHLGIKLSAELISLHEHNEASRLEKLVEIAKEQTLVLVSDAGMPTISDPGFMLVRACSDAGIEIQVVPGPSAVLAALAVSGLATDRFCFEGFIPRRSGERTRLFSELQNERRTMIFFESPHRIQESLKAAVEAFGEDRKASLSRELTKKFEETRRGSLQELLLDSEGLKGELVLVIAGAKPKETSLESLVPEVLTLKNGGLGLKQAVSLVAAREKVSSSELYDLCLKSK
jgi:16S rRNA (cytidine1402-2'-O)-methyltransferase